MSPKDERGSPDIAKKPFTKGETSLRVLVMLLLTVAVFFASAVSARADSLHLEAGHDIYWLPPRADFFEDTTKGMSLDRVLVEGSFAPMRDRGFGNASSAYWIRFAYASASPPDAFYLFLGYKPTFVDF